MIDEQNFFDQPVRNNLRTYDSIWKITTGQGDDYTTSYLLDYTQLAHDVPGASPEGPRKVLKSGTYRDSQRSNTKIDDLIKKMFFH